MVILERFLNSNLFRRPGGDFVMKQRKTILTFWKFQIVLVIQQQIFKKHQHIKIIIVSQIFINNFEVLRLWQKQLHFKFCFCQARAQGP